MQFSIPQNHAFCVFTHSIDGKIVRTDHGPLPNALMFYEPTPNRIIVEIILTAETADQARIMFDALGLKRTIRPKGKRAIHCVETGQVWETCRGAALSIGVSQPTLWQHLNKPYDVPTVRGRRYRYGLPSR